MEEYLKEKISRLIGEIEQLEKQGVSTQKRGTVVEAVYDSDLGVKVPFETTGWVSMSPDEIKSSQREKEIKLYSLRSELKQAQDELFKLEWDKPENVSRREEEALIRGDKEQEKQLKEERLEHEERYDDLNKLVEYLKIAGLDDIANRLSQLRFAFQKPKSDYINREIDLQSKEKTFNSRTQTTKKEYKEIKRSVIRLSKSATSIAKKYKDLYKLYLGAWEIVRDIEKKGISKMHGSELSIALENYFTQPTGEYLFRDYGSYYSRKESENLGYQYLAFYRDYGSKYNEDVRKHKI